MRVTGVISTLVRPGQGLALGMRSGFGVARLGVTDEAEEVKEGLVHVVSGFG